MTLQTSTINQEWAKTSSHLICPSHRHSCDSEAAAGSRGELRAQVSDVGNYAQCGYLRAKLSMTRCVST